MATTRRFRRPRAGRRRRHPDAVRHPEGAAHPGRAQHALARPARRRQGRPAAPGGGVWARTATGSPRPSANSPTDLGRPIDVAVQDQQLGTGHAVTLRTVGAAGGLRRHGGRHLRRHPAARRRHPGRSDRHPPQRAGRGDGADHHGAGLDRLRPHPAHPGRRGHRDRRGDRRHPAAAGDPRGQCRRLRLRHRRTAFGAEPAVARTTPSTSCTSPTSSRSCGPTGSAVHAKHVDDAALVAGVNDRVQLSDLAAELNRRIVAAHQRAGVTDRRPGDHLDRRRRIDRS